MAKPTYEQLQEKIAELAQEINELRDPSNNTEVRDALRKELDKAERGQDAMLKEAKRLSEELSELRTKYVQVPKDLWESIEKLPGLVYKARQAHPLLCSMNEAVMLTDLNERWSEVIK